MDADPAPMEGGEVRFRIYVEGELVDEEKLVFTTEASDRDTAVASAAERQMNLAREADAAGRPYLVEIIFWDGEHVRWGTDVDGMVVPVEVGVETLAEAIATRWGKTRCDSIKFGYICQRGAPHIPGDLHAQLVARLSDGDLRVAIWRDEVSGVRITRVPPAGIADLGAA